MNTQANGYERVSLYSVLGLSQPGEGEAVLTQKADVHVRGQPLAIPATAAMGKCRPNITAVPHFQKNLEIWTFMGK